MEGEKIPGVDIQEEEIKEVSSPYKAGMEDILKLPTFQGIRDADYVENLKEDARVNLEIRRHGPTAERLLRKSGLEANLGNFEASAGSAKDAEVISPKMEEAYFDEGKALLLHAMMEAGVINGGPQVEKGSHSVEDLLRKAKKSLAKALELDPNDEEAEIILKKLTALLESVTPKEEESTN